MIERLSKYFLKKKRNSFNRKLIKIGALKVGVNSNIDNLEIVFSSKIEKDFSNITIGDNCNLNCKIEIYNSNAKVIIGDRVYIGPESRLFCNCGITFGDDILLSWGITIIDTNAHSINFDERKSDLINWNVKLKDWSKVKNSPVQIHSKVWVGFNSIITKGVSIGEYAIISCGSVVVKDVNKKTIVGGNPAVLIKNNEN